MTKKRIILESKQLGRLMKNINKEKKTIVITESQFNKLMKKPNKVESKSMNDIDDLDFYEAIIDCIPSIIHNTGEVPKLLVDLGIKLPKLKHMLIGQGVLKAVKGNDGVVSLKVKADGLSKSLGKIKEVILKDSTENVNSDENIDESSDNLPMGAENDPNAPWNEKGEPEYKTNLKIGNIHYQDDEWLIVDINDEPYLVTISYMENNREFNTSELAYFIDHTFEANDSYELLNNQPDVSHMKLTPDTASDFLSNFQPDHDDPLLDKLRGFFEVTEMTTTGSVGGSYETPSCWSKDPKKPGHSDKTMIKGGKFVNPEQITDFDTIRESVGKKKIFEELVFKKDTENNKIILMSDKQSQAERGRETYPILSIVKKYGFAWDKQYASYSTSIENISKAKELKSVLFKCKQAFEALSDLEEYVSQMENPSDEVVKGAEAQGAKVTRKEEVEGMIREFYDDLEKDLDNNKYVEFSIEYIKFVTAFKDKFNKNYSPRNLMLIFIQKPGATAVGTINDWKKVDRVLNKGARGILLYKPNAVKKYAKDDSIVGTDQDSEENYNSYQTYSTFFVFDVSDTKNADGSEDPAVLTTHWQPPNEPEERADFLAEIIQEIIKNDGIKISFDPSRRGEGGFSANDKINISKGTQGERLLSVLVHEYAHELLHWDKGPFARDVKRKELSPMVKEVQAEGIAYAIMKYFEFDVTPAKTYIQGWQGKGDDKVRISDNVDIMVKVCGYITNKIHSKIKELQNQEA